MHPNDCGEGPAAAFLSWPASLKHLSFDGRYLHAAPPSLDVRTKRETTNADAPIDAKVARQKERRKRRATFLVNVWLYFHPMNVDLFPESMLDKMSGHSASAASSSGQEQVGLSFVHEIPDSASEIKVDPEAPSQTTQNHLWPMGDCGSGETIAIQLPVKETLQKEADFGGNIRVLWKDSSSGLKLEKQKPLGPAWKRARTDG
uniref:Uncharacterized protein n=2 Tax=Entomoneis paludosa TaxID=265537 RepID=A0A7S2V8V5_9STRA|mmetsp:Transcript_12486/g.25869  ORF Transcript_12486/g.25869 Transcript_12486/m.25869 type:complete len:203 (+) Transcript_12486:202-810(+)